MTPNYSEQRKKLQGVSLTNQEIIHYSVALANVQVD